jgi:methylenetetrahydrofolate dehydrogenase (NADP+)/methenyltetrahydrofolate cyclohydrolase
MPHGYGAISFPGLGIYDLEINRVAFSVFGKDIYWYGIIIATGFFLGVMLASRLAKRSGIDPDRIIDLTLFATPVAIIGARAYYVLTTLGEYDSFYEIIAIWNGGIAIYGAIIAGLAVVLIYCRVKKLPLMRVLDCLAPAVILGQAIGRWGNFVNQEAFGGVCDLPWRMELVIGGEVTAVHPTFLYESLWNAIGFALLLFIFHRKKQDGQVFWSYMGWYGFGRFFIEGLRTDSLYVGQFRISQLVGVAAVAISLVMLLKKNKNVKVGSADTAALDGIGSAHMAKIIDGKAISAEIRKDLALEVAGMQKAPGLAVVLVGDDPGSQVYVRNKGKACKEVGIAVKEFRLPTETTQYELMNLVDSLNADPEVNGILVQTPLPKHLDPGPVVEQIDEKKDVDAFHPANVGRIMLGSYTFAPCTPAGVMELLDRSGVTVEGKECVVVGRSNIVGKPQAMLLMHKNGTVTVCHSKTKDLPEVTRRADILIVAIGKPKFVTADMVKEGAVVIDVGMNRSEDGKLCGDVDFEEVAKKASAITPVPGGVGPMTITMLLKNTIAAAKLQQK